MTKFERFMTKFDNFMIKFSKIIKYFCILCIGSGITLIIEYGFNLDFIFFTVLPIIILCCTTIKNEEDKREIRDEKM